MRSIPAIVLVAATCLSVARAQDGPTVDLNITRVAIFNSGVAYFEAEATVTGDATGELSFRTEQINDILKSLAVQDLGGGTVGVVRYASQDPIERTLKSFGVDITGNPRLAELLKQLRGQPVEITGERQVTGVIVGVEQRQTKTDEGLITLDLVNVLTDGGIQQIAIDEIRGIKLANEDIADELRKALAVLATASDTEKKTVQLHFRGQGQRTVRVAYLLEAPIWKTTYRLALDDEQRPFLQGWATVDNATERDWEDVQLALVSGRPISFRMDLYTPIYVPRPLEELELYAGLRPPTYEGAMEEEAGRKIARLGVEPSTAPMPTADMAARGRREMGAAGYAAGEALRAGIHLRDGGVEAMAAAGEAGELFQYTINMPVSIRRQQSAMLPIVNQEIAGEKVAIYNPATHPQHPFNGLELTNTTGLHLMQGPVTVSDEDVYAGDAKLPSLAPDEKRLIAYALELAIDVDVRQESTPTRVVGMKIVGGTLITSTKYVDAREYVVKNKSDRQRTVLIEQAYSDDWKLVEPAEPYERTDTLSRFKLEVPARETGTLRVALERVTDQRIALASLNIDQMLAYVRSRTISGELRQAFERAVALQRELQDARRRREQADTQLDEALADQARIRQNLTALERGTDVHRRQMDKFDQVETQIEQLRERIEQLRHDEEQRRAALDDYLRDLNVE